MARAELGRASNLLKDAAKVTGGGMQERLYERSDQLATLVTREQGPDYERLTRHMTALHDLTEDLDDDAAETVREARNKVLEYYKGIPGV